MATLKSDHPLVIPELHTGQRLIKAELKKRNFIAAHRGWRKSSFGIHLVIEHLLTKQNAGWYAPTFNVVTGANWIDFKNACDGDESWFNKSESTWSIPGYGTCFFYSMDRPATARGGTFSLAVGEELGEWPTGVFESVVEPIVQKVDGVFVGIGTPNTVNPLNDFHTLVEQAKDFPDTHNSYVIPAWGADLVDGELAEGVSEYSPYICRESPFKSFQAMKDSYARSRNRDRWRIEYLCHWISSQGNQFAGIDECCTIKPELVYG